MTSSRVVILVSSMMIPVGDSVIGDTKLRFNNRGAFNIGIARRDCNTTITATRYDSAATSTIYYRDTVEHLSARQAQGKSLDEGGAE